MWCGGVEGEVVWCGGVEGEVVWWCESEIA